MPQGMNQNSAQLHPAENVELALRDDLARGDALIGTIAPILRHLLANDEHSVFSDEIIARVRGMTADIARQLLTETAIAGGELEQRDQAAERVGALVASLVGHGGFLAHVHALAVEWQLTGRMQARLALDPVLPPLLQALIASSDAAVASSAMALLASLARFAASQRRMLLPLSELPGDLLHAALLALRSQAGDDPAEQAATLQAEQTLRGRYDESRSRLGLISRIVMGMGGGATAALAITHAGVGIFLSALALASGQDRAMAVLATNEGQLARFALGLRAAGLKPQAIEEQFVYLHPDGALPSGFEQLGCDQAAALLARSASFPGG